MHLAGQIRPPGVAGVWGNTGLDFFSVLTVLISVLTVSTHQAPGLLGYTTQNQLEEIPVFPCCWSGPQGLSLGPSSQRISRYCS